MKVSVVSLRLSSSIAGSVTIAQAYVWCQLVIELAGLKLLVHVGREGDSNNLLWVSVTYPNAVLHGLIM